MCVHLPVPGCSTGSLVLHFGTATKELQPNNTGWNSTTEHSKPQFDASFDRWTLLLRALRRVRPCGWQSSKFEFYQTPAATATTAGLELQVTTKSECNCTCSSKLQTIQLSHPLGRMILHSCSSTWCLIFWAATVGVANCQQAHTLLLAACCGWKCTAAFPMLRAACLS